MDRLLRQRFPFESILHNTPHPFNPLCPIVVLLLQVMSSQLSISWTAAILSRYCPPSLPPSLSSSLTPSLSPSLPLFLSLPLSHCVICTTHIALSLLCFVLCSRLKPAFIGHSTPLPFLSSLLSSPLPLSNTPIYSSSFFPTSHLLIFYPSIAI
jgi:hypothetical protein